MAATCEQDLQLLRSTVSYLSRMTSEGAMASKLENIARVFTSLAELYVQVARKQYARNQSSWDSNKATGLCAPPHLPTAPPSVEGASAPSSADISMDSVLNWFSSDSHSQGLFTPADGQFLEAYTPSEQMGLIDNEDDIFGSLSDRTRKRPLECDFDWISWDIAGTGALPGL